MGCVSTLEVSRSSTDLEKERTQKVTYPKLTDQQYSIINKELCWRERS